MDKKNKPKNGSISLKQGKATMIIWEDREQQFGVFFVAKQMRQALKRSRPGFYTERLRGIMRDLERGGLFAIPECKRRLKSLAPGAKDLNQQYLKVICGWLGQLEMFRRVNTKPKPESAIKKYCDNYDRIFVGG